MNVYSMDLINNKFNNNSNINSFNVNIEKKTKIKDCNKSILCQNKNRDNCFTQSIDINSDKEISKISDSPQSQTKLIEDSSDSIEKSSDNRDYDKAIPHKLLDEILQLFVNSLKVSKDFIHERYVSYSRQTQEQRDSTKTEYTYALSFSYNKNLNPLNIWEWTVPNMSRKSISSVKISSHLTETSTMFSNREMSINSSCEQSSDSGTQSVTRVSPAQVHDSRKTMFTRSHCLGGRQCEAGCEVHKNVRKRGHKYQDSKVSAQEVEIPFSGCGLEPQIEFSDDEDYARNNSINARKQNNYMENGLNSNHTKFYGYDEDEEEITYVRRVTNIFRTTINHTSKLIDSMTPNKVKSVTRNYPFVWLLFKWFLFLGFIGLFIYLISQHISSRTPFDALNSDISSNYAINHMLNELKLIKEDLRQLQSSNSDLKLQIESSELDRKKFDKFDDKIESIEDSMLNILKNCCRNETDQMLALIDSRLAAFMSSMLSENNQKQSLTPSEAAIELKAFIQSELSKSNDQLKGNIEQKLVKSIEQIENKLNQNSNSNSVSSSVSMDEIKSLIHQALAIYDADKTGQPDFALEPAGGTVINTRCSETFDPYGVQYRIFGMPVWSSSISPRAVIQPNISPGECWAFRGSEGYLVIKLSQTIVPTAFSYEHIPKQISRDGNIDSAPKEFQVRALDDESDTRGELLGNYVYEDNETPMQHFVVQDPNPKPIQLIELVILSNHGHSEYTCLYRFRVHGKRVNY